MKPIVFYEGIASFHTSLDGTWEYARVFCKYHPKLGENVDVRTSKIVEKHHMGFTTLNTVYIQREEVDYA